MRDLQQLRDGRNMPWLRRGMGVDMDGRRGVLTSGNLAHVRVRFEGQKHSSFCHPKWEMTYYDKNGNVVMDYKAKKGTQQEVQG